MNLAAKPRKKRTILHVDVDAFFASAEQVAHPEYRGKPVIVGGRADDRSVVASASYEARARGVKTAMVVAEAARRCPEGIFLRGTYYLYEEFSAAIAEILRGFSPLVQKVSPDDFYLDLTGCELLYGFSASALNVAEQIKLCIKENTGLSVSIGLGRNRLIAKIASDNAKPNGIIEIRPGYEAVFIRPMEAAVIPGIGDRTLEQLHKFNLHTAGDLARLDPALLEKTFGPKGLHLWQHANGEDDAPVVHTGPPKSISRETTFEQDVADRRQLEAMLYYLTERAARHLRALGMKARCVTAKIRYSDFQTPVASKSLPAPTDQDEAFYPLALQLMRNLLNRRMRVRLVGVCLSSLSGCSPVAQTELWRDRQSARRERLCRSLDQARNRFGFKIVTAGPALRLLKELEQDNHGFRLKTSCLTR